MILWHIVINTLDNYVAHHPHISPQPHHIKFYILSPQEHQAQHVTVYCQNNVKPGSLC